VPLNAERDHRTISASRLTSSRSSVAGLKTISSTPMAASESTNALTSSADRSNASGNGHGGSVDQVCHAALQPAERPGVRLVWDAERDRADLGEALVVLVGEVEVEGGEVCTLR
jgi:hypothetical protein